MSDSISRECRCGYPELHVTFECPKVRLDRNGGRAFWKTLDFWLGVVYLTLWVTLFIQFGGVR